MDENVSESKENCPLMQPIRTFSRNIGGNVKAHPFIAFSGILLTLCTGTLCRYFGTTVLAALLFWASQPKKLPSEENDLN